MPGLNLQFSVELTNYCNMKCKLCPHSIYKQDGPSGNKFDRSKGYMTSDVFDRVVANAKHAREIVMGFFGEQTLHPRFAEYVKRLRPAIKRRMILNTNWSMVTEEMFPVIEMFNQVRISIDASNARLYEQLCPGGAFLGLDGKSSKDRYGTLVKKIERWFDRPKHPETWLIYVTSTINRYDRDDFVKQWLPKTPRRDRVITKRSVSYGGVMQNDTMAAGPCTIPTDRRVTIAWTGDCSPCNLDVNMSLAAGNLLDTPDIKEIVGSQKWRQRLKRIRDRKGVCANCFDANNHTSNVSRPGRRRP